MRIALIICPFGNLTVPPYNLALLSACLRKEGHDVFCFDLNARLQRYIEFKEGTGDCPVKNDFLNWYDKGQVLEFMEKYDYYISILIEEILGKEVGVVGFSIYDSSRWFSEEAASRIKKEDPSIKVIFGGYPCFREDFSLLLMDNQNIDAVCLGEGEFSLNNLIRQFEESQSDLSFCAGFIYRDKNNRIVNCGKESPILNLDLIPFSDFSDFDLKLYDETAGLGISTSRGCINHCLFCEESVLLHPFRKRTALNIYSEISYQSKKYPLLEYLSFNDSAINGDMKELNELISLLTKNKLTFIRWGGQAMIREEMNLSFLKKMKEAGFSSVSYGLETASPKILKKMGKNFNLEIAEKVIEDTNKAGIYQAVNIITGFPGETQLDIIMTSHFLKRNLEFIDEVFIHPLVLLPNSLLYKKREHFGIVVSDMNPKKGWHSEGGMNNFKARMENARFLKDSLGDKVKVSFNENS